LKESFEGEHTSIAISGKKGRVDGSFWVERKKDKDRVEN
jgi:hypothetical protein